MLIAFWNRWRSDRRPLWLGLALVYVLVVESLGWKLVVWELEQIREAW